MSQYWHVTSIIRKSCKKYNNILAFNKLKLILGEVILKVFLFFIYFDFCYDETCKCIVDRIMNWNIHKQLGPWLEAALSCSVICFPNDIHPRMNGLVWITISNSNFAKYCSTWFYIAPNHYTIL